MFFLIKYCCNLNYIANTNTCSDNLESYRTTFIYAHADEAEASIQKIIKDEWSEKLKTAVHQVSEDEHPQTMPSKATSSLPGTLDIPLEYYFALRKVLQDHAMLFKSELGCTTVAREDM